MRWSIVISMLMVLSYSSPSLAKQSLTTGCECTKAKPKKVKIQAKSAAKPTTSPSCCDTQSEVKSESKNTNAQTVTVNVKPSVYHVPYRVIERVRIRKVAVDHPNHLQILVGQSRTKLEVQQTDCCNFTASKKREIEAGLQYIRDFGRFTGSVMGTINENFLVGFGFNW